MLHTVIARSEVLDRHGSAHVPGLWTRIIIQVVPRYDDARVECGPTRRVSAESQMAKWIIAAI